MKGFSFPTGKAPTIKLPKPAAVVVVKPRATVGAQAPHLPNSGASLRALQISPARRERSAGKKLLRGKLL
ncbi:MAG: hypothetical protein WAN65_19180 [Candidatus Sulfotelmatobacter sp.]